MDPFSLEWSAPAGCPDVVWVRAHTEALLGAPAASLARRSLEVRGVVARIGGHVELSLSTVDDGIHGERTIAGDTCEEVSAAGALVIALAVDPKAVADNAPASIAAFELLSSPPPAAPSVQLPSPAPARTPAIVAPAPTPQAAPRPQDDSAPRTGGQGQTHGVIGAHAAADVGSLPKLAPGLGVNAGFQTERVTVRLSATYFLPTLASRGTSGSSPGADVSLGVVDVAGCYATTSGQVVVAPCAGLEGGFLFATGVGLESAAERVREWMAGKVGAEATLHPAEPVTLRVGLDAVLPFTRPSVGYTPRPEAIGSNPDFRTLYRASPVAFRGGIGIGFRFR